MALISLAEARQYLRVDSTDENALIESLLQSALMLVKDISKISDEKWEAVEKDDGTGFIGLRASLRIAVFYTLGYLFEHREEADHHELVLTLRNLLFSVREGFL